MAQLMNLGIIILFLPPVLVMFAFSPPACFFSFLMALIIPFFAGKSRRVSDPVAGILRHTILSPSDFHEWAKLVCSSGQYERDYESHVYDSNRGYDQKLPLVFSQVKAINYIHAWKVLLFLLIPINAFCIWDLFYSNLTFRAPIPIGITIGSIWGYAFGIYVLWRSCRLYKNPWDDLPL